MPNALYQTYQSGLMSQTFYAQNYPRPTGLALLLCSQPPTVNSIVEVPNVGGYSRIGIPQTQAVWSYPYPNSGIVFNNNQLSFGVCSAYVGWCSGIAIADCTGYGGGITGSGSILFYGTISPAKELNVNDQLYIPTSGLSCRMS